MRRDSVIFYLENNRIDNADRRCLLNKTKPFYLELVLQATRSDYLVTVKSLECHCEAQRAAAISWYKLTILLAVIDHEKTQISHSLQHMHYYSA